MLILLLSCRFLEFMSFMFRTREDSFLAVKPEVKVSRVFLEERKVGFATFLGELSVSSLDLTFSL